jgi:DICT domain-containing protein
MNATGHEASKFIFFSQARFKKMFRLVIMTLILICPFVIFLRHDRSIRHVDKFLDSAVKPQNDRLQQTALQVAERQLKMCFAGRRGVSTIPARDTNRQEDGLWIP